ncbi:helix-turn-helix domain-containing protein [Methylobacterium sp. J-030]|uniref:AraC-like ligand-binding domain-containing protein n=1 Tax=Methylobacterium sp. J-030 TaxID=2836627 RepID=UPI001FBB4A33|nr:helix-turn-helix domain-containing protein [Methylobacterium sp. J-030]MCJ2067897.1 helix-turn-helix domain-containing protein [Methylobacterium sp. J-030]
MYEGDGRFPRVDGKRDISAYTTLTMSTDAVPLRARFDYWIEACRSMFGGFEFVDLEPKGFQAAVNVLTVDNLTISHYVGVPHAMIRTKSHIRSADNDFYLVILASERTFRMEHGRYCRSGPGGIALMDNTQPFVGGHPEGLDIINVFIPRAVLERAVGPARSLTGLTIDATQTSFPIITSYLATLIKHSATLDPERQARMAAVAVELIAAGFSEKLQTDPPRSLSGAAILSRAQAFIADHLGVEGLSINDVAAGLNISVRRLQEVASAESVALMDWMWERRMQQARAKLADPAQISVPVGLIAYQCGFASQAHFSRRFKERFGQTPTEYKAASSITRAAQTARPVLSALR